MFEMEKYIKNLFCIPESISLKNYILFEKTTLVLDTFISNNHNFVRSFLSKHKNCITTIYFYGKRSKSTFSTVHLLNCGDPLQQ